MEYLDSVKECIQECIKNSEDITGKISKTQERADKKVFTQEYADSEIKELQKNLTILKNNCMDSINDLASSEIERIHKLDTLKPEDITEDIKLLNCGIPLTFRDIEDMANRNKDNRTMLQLITRYSKEHGIKDSLGKDLTYISDTGTLKKQVESVQYASETVLKWLGTPNIHTMYTKIFEGN